MDFGSPTRLYAKNELEQYFELDIQEVAITNELPISDCYDRIKECYNGYKFSKNAELVYNPFSTLKLLNSKDFSSYWFETGTPAFATSKAQCSKLLVEISSNLYTSLWNYAQFF